MSVRSVLRECMADLLETEDAVTVEQIVGCAYRNHEDVFADHAEQMMLNHARQMTRDMLRESTEDDDEQMTFSGLGLPSTICVQGPNGTRYVRSDKATWSDLKAGRMLRFDNAKAAQRKLDRYDDVLDRLQPVMEHNPSLTVAEAVRLMAVAS